MKLNEIPLIGGFYKDEDRDWSVQDCVNYLPTVAEAAGTRTQTMLRTAPGLRPLVRIPGAGPCRGVYNCEGRLFAVFGDTLYLIGSNLIGVPVGVIPGVEKVQFAHNQATASGQNQLVIGNGNSGYLYNTNTKEFKRITDEGFIGGISPIFVDSYIVWVSSNRLCMLNSSVADAAEYNTLDQFQSEYSPDKLVCAIASSSELVAMSERSIEFFQNTGANEQPFRSKGISIDLGAASRWGAIICDFSVFFLASDGTFRRIDNYNATRISNGPVEQAIRDLDWTQAQAYVWEEGRYKVVYWTFPDGYTFGWDIANGMWHRRVSYGLDRWRVSSTARWNGKTVAGDFQRGDLWAVDSNYFLEGDQEYNCEITGPYIHGDGNLVKMPRMDIVMQTGQQDTIPEQFPPHPGVPQIIGNAPPGNQTESYSYQYSADGGLEPYVFSVAAGELPAGLSMSSGGLISGIASGYGVYNYIVKVVDANGMTSQIRQSVSIKVAPLGFLPETATPTLLLENSNQNFKRTNAGDAFAITNARTRQIPNGSWYFEADTRGATNGGAFNWGVIGVMPISDYQQSPSSMQTVYGSSLFLIDGSTFTWGFTPGLSPLLVGYNPGLTEMFRTRHRLIVNGNSFTHFMALRDGDWQQMYIGSNGPVSVFGCIRGNTDLVAEPGVLYAQANLKSRVDEFMYPIPAGYTEISKA